MSAAQVSRKTINNALKGRHDGKLSTFDSIATALDVPLWVLMIPGLDRHPEFLQGDRMQRLVALVENYLTCSNTQRADTELVAIAGAVVRRVGGAS